MFRDVLAADLSEDRSITLILTNDGQSLPGVLPFTVQIDDEKIQITQSLGKNQGGQWQYLGLRDVLGSTIESHSAGAIVTGIPSPVYDLADFSGLFQSGLVVA